MRDEDFQSWPNHEVSRFVKAGGLNWHVQQTGRGPALLLVHGTGASTHSWRGLMPLLARDYSVMAVDLPGHGFTEPAGGTRSSIRGMSAALGALLRAAQFAPDYVVGHSAGAVLLCRLALDHGISPRVIVSLNGAFLPLGGAAVFAPLARLLGSVSLVPRLVAWSAGNPANVARMIAATGSRLDAEGLELYARLVRRPGHVAGALEMMGNWNLDDFEKDLSRLEPPLALIVGGNDRTVPPSQALRVRQRVPRAEIHRLPGLGHLAHEEAPAVVASEVLRICAAYRPGA